MGIESIIHLRVPAALKGRWVRLSRAAGTRLTDWVVAQVEENMRKVLTGVRIPDDLAFADLKLSREPDGGVSADLAVVRRVCEASGIPEAWLVDAPEDNMAALVVGWYEAHRAAGGAPDPVAEDLIAEARAEDAVGQPYSLPPGRA